MDTEDSLPVTRLLLDWSGGDERALDRLIPVVYDELRLIADRYLRSERDALTLQPTALVHEAFIKLVDQRVSWQNRAHFFAISAQIMRRLLVDHARRKHAEKRGGSGETISLEALGDWPEAEAAVDLVRVDDALKMLAAVDSQQARVVELRFFGGLSVDETAAALGVSESTVKREWRMARAWLLRELQRN